MDKTRALSILIIVRSLDMNKYSFRLWENDEEILSPEIPYLNTNGTLMYLPNNNQFDIGFSVYLLVRFSSSSIWEH
jgi:hypothetical protein